MFLYFTIVHVHLSTGAGDLTTIVNSHLHLLLKEIVSLGSPWRIAFLDLHRFLNDLLLLLLGLLHLNASRLLCLLLGRRRIDASMFECRLLAGEALLPTGAVDNIVGIGLGTGRPTIR